MKKLIAVIITFIFIFDSTGYCLRPELGFSAQRKSPEYLCKILAEYIGKSMRESISKNKAINTQVLDIGVTYTDLTPKRLLKESMPEENYHNLITQIEGNDIKMDIDREGNIWISCEPNDIYIKINKDGYYGNRIKSEFHDVVEREIKIVFEAERIDAPAAQIKEKLHIDINLAVEGLNTFHVFIDSLPQNLRNRIKDLLWLKAVYAGITPVAELFSDPALKYLDLSDRQRLISAITANSDFLVVKHDTKHYFIINVKAASGAIRNNEDILPSEALHRTRKWLKEYSWQWMGTQDNRIYALLRGVPRNAAAKLPLFSRCVDMVSSQARSKALNKIQARNAHFVLEQIKANSKGPISGKERKHYHGVIKSIMKDLLSDKDMNLLLDSFNIDIRIIKYRGFEEYDAIWARDLERIFEEAIDIVEKRVEAVNVAAIPSVSVYGDEKLTEELYAQLKSRPNDFIIGNKLANGLIKAGRVDEAIGICKDMCAVILRRKTEIGIDFTNRDERMTDTMLVTAYIHAGRFDEAIELGLEGVKKFPEDIIFRRILMRAYIKAGRFDEAIERGLEIVRKFPKDLPVRVLLTNAYINRAEKNVIIGAPYEKDYLAAMDLRPNDLTIKHRLVYLGLLPNDMNGILDSRGVLERVVNINTGEEYALTKERFYHIISKHVDRAISDLEIAYSSFPADIDINIVKEFILEAVKYGSRFNEKLPWWHHDTIVWYVGDNRPDLAKKTGIERIEIKAYKGRILTAFPVIGKGVDVRRGEFKIDTALTHILPSASFFMWNANSRERISVLAGRDKWGVGVIVSNDTVFGKAVPLIQREYIMWQALWKGEFIGYQKAKNDIKSGARAPVYVEFYKYEIPDELMAKYSFSNKTIYFYVDYVSRRLINVMADKPYIDSAKIREPEIRPVDSLRSPAPDSNNEIVTERQLISTRACTLSELQGQHKIGKHMPDKDELCERWGYYYDQEAGVFYRNREEYEQAEKGKKEAIGEQQTASDSAQPGTVGEIIEPKKGIEGENQIVPEQIEPVSAPEVILKAQKPNIPKISITLKLTNRQKTDLRKLPAIRLLIKKVSSIGNDELELLANAALDDIDISAIKANIRSLKNVEGKLLNKVIGELKQFMAQIAKSKAEIPEVLEKKPGIAVENIVLKPLANQSL